MQPDKNKVLFASFETIPAATGSACWSTEIIRGLSRVFEVDGMSLKNDDLSHIERYHRARLLRVPTAGEFILDHIKAYQRALQRQLGSEEYRLCHFTSIWEGMVLASRRKDQAYKLIYQVHSLPSIDFRHNHPEMARHVETSYSLKQQEERCFDAADHLLAGSDLIREHLLSRGVPQAKISVIPPALDLAPFESSAPGTGQAGTMVYLGSLRPWQGVVSLIQALASLPRHLRVRLLLISAPDDPAYKEVRGKIQLHGLSRNVEFIDPAPLDRLAPIIRQASICLAPLANHEHNRRAAAMPHKVLVYMASHRPIIAARQPALRGLLDDGTTALLYSPGDTAGLQNAIQRLLLDKDLAVRLSNQARLHLEENYSLAGALEKIFAVYRQLIGLPVSKATPTDPTGAGQVDPGRPAAPFGADPETKKVPDLRYADTGSALCQDTDPGAQLPTAAELDTDPNRQPKAQPDSDTPIAAVPELVFRQIEDADTAPRAIATEADDWVVMDVADVGLADRQATLEPATPETGKRRRFLLGGPSYPVEEDEALAPDDSGKVATVRSGTPLGAREEPPLIPDDDVEFTEPDDK